MSAIGNCQPAQKTAEQYYLNTGPDEFRASVLSGPQTFGTAIQPMMVPGPKDVVVRLQGCGVCASNLAIWEGRPWFEYPLPVGTPGHEGWGIVQDIGEEVNDVHPGQRVAFLGDKSFAEFACVPANHVVVLPKALDDIPFPGEAIACAMNIFERSDIQPGQKVAIVGAGFLGLLLTQLAVTAGADVFVLSRRACVRERAFSYGAKAVFDTEDWWGNARRVVELTRGSGCERVIEATGLQFALDAATEMIAEYGKLIIGGFHQDGLRHVNMQTWNWRGIDVINAHERAPSRYIDGMQRGILATLNGNINPLDLLTHRFTLQNLDEAFTLMTRRPEGFIKGWVQL